MNAPDYQPPVDRLLTYGDCRKMNHKKWPNYPLELGLTPDHIPELIRMVKDPQWDEYPVDRLEVWTGIHACRSLGQLKAEAAIEPLISLFHEQEDDDWFCEDIPEVFALIGPKAIPALKRYLTDSSRSLYPCDLAASSLCKIALSHPESRDVCVSAIAAQLEKFYKNDPELNGLLIAYLIDLKAVEQVKLMRRAYHAQKVEELINGTWEDVQIELGLKALKKKFLQPHKSSLDFSLPDISDLQSQSQSKSKSPRGFGQKSTASKPKKSKKKQK